MANQVARNKDDDDSVSIREAARTLGVNRTWLSGYLRGRGIRLVPVGSSLGVRRRDLRLVRVPPRPSGPPN